MRSKHSKGNSKLFDRRRARNLASWSRHATRALDSRSLAADSRGIGSQVLVRCNSAPEVYFLRLLFQLRKGFPALATRRKAQSKQSAQRMGQMAKLKNRHG